MSQLIAPNNDHLSTMGKSGILTEREEIEICYAIGEWYLTMKDIINNGPVGLSIELNSVYFIASINESLHKNSAKIELSILKYHYLIEKFNEWKKKWLFNLDSKNKTHNLGFIKEKLKDMICGYDKEDYDSEIDKISIYSY